MKAIIAHSSLEFSFVDSDVVNLEEFIAQGEYNPHDIHPSLLHDHGFTVAVVFASNLQDALDTAVDEGKMDRYAITDADDYTEDDAEEFAYLGNAGEPFDIDTLGVVELDNPARSFAAQFNAEAPRVRYCHCGC